MLRALMSVVLLVIVGYAASPQHDHVPSIGVSSETPSWSPDAKRLVFSAGPALHHQIYVIDVEGRQARRLTAGEQTASSPDGRWLAFSAGLNRTYALTIMAADGSGRRTLTRTDALPGER